MWVSIVWLCAFECSQWRDKRICVCEYVLSNNSPWDPSMWPCWVLCLWMKLEKVLTTLFYVYGKYLVERIWWALSCSILYAYMHVGVSEWSSRKLRVHFMCEYEENEYYAEGLSNSWNGQQTRMQVLSSVKM